MLKVFILSNEDFTSNLIFSGLFGAKDVEIVGVGFTTSLLTKKGKSKNKLGNDVMGVLKKTGFSYWFYLIFTNGFFKVYERLAILFANPKRSSFPKAIRAKCKFKNIPIYKVSNVNDPEFVNTVKDSGAEICVIRINQIFKKEILNTPKYGMWCIHSSLLPAYGGIAGEFHAIANGDSEIGTTIFQVSLELDKGPLLYQESFRVDKSKSMLQHMLANNLLAQKMLKSYAELFSKQKSLSTCLNKRETSPSHYSWPDANKVQAFKKQFGPLMRLKDMAQYALSCLLLPLRFKDFDLKLSNLETLKSEFKSEKS
ncbi:MAG: formyltransferase family protein [Pseudomonadales bacterium]